MSEDSSATPLEPPTDDPQPNEERRCPDCDAVVSPEASQCIMCGASMPPPAMASASSGEAPKPVTPAVVTSQTEFEPAETSLPVQLPDVDPPEAATPAAVTTAPVFVTTLHERRSPALWVLTAVFAIVIMVLGALIIRFQSPVVEMAVFPSTTPQPPTPSRVPTGTPFPTQTPRPTQTPTLTPTPAPSLTPQPPRPHQVNAGDTLIGIAVRYRVSMDSIAGLNGFDVETPIQAGQTLSIPWPTPTPPLVPVALEVNGEVVIADPADCNRYQVQGGDSLSAIAARYDVSFELFLRVNRLADDYVLQPGETLCIPEIVYGGSLPPTPGPSPTPSPIPPLAGPHLLYPVDGTAIDPPQQEFVLQWVAAKDLEEDEWYMVEMTNLDDLDAPLLRGFTRDNAFRVPVAWRPAVPQSNQFRWRVSIVIVTGTRSDGQFLYTYGSESSADGFFSWAGGNP